MRVTSLTILTAAVIAACARPAVDLVAEQAAVEARSKGIAAAEAAQNADSALTFWADDAIVQPAGSPQIQGKEAIRALYGSFFDSGQLKSFEGTASRIVVAGAGDLAYEYGVNRMVFASPKGDMLDVGKYLVIWRKQNGAWFIAALSFTSDAAAPVPVATK